MHRQANGVKRLLLEVEAMSEKLLGKSFVDLRDNQLYAQSEDHVYFR